MPDAGLAALSPQIVVVCASGEWCGHAADDEHADRLRVMFDQKPAKCGPHRAEVWTKMDADEAAHRPHEPHCRACEGQLDYPDEQADQLCRWCADPSYREIHRDGIRTRSGGSA